MRALQACSNTDPLLDGDLIDFGRAPHCVAAPAGSAPYNFGAVGVPPAAWVTRPPSVFYVAIIDYDQW